VLEAPGFHALALFDVHVAIRFVEVFNTNPRQAQGIRLNKALETEESNRATAYTSASSWRTLEAELKERLQLVGGEIDGVWSKIQRLEGTPVESSQPTAAGWMAAWTCWLIPERRRLGCGHPALMELRKAASLAVGPGSHNARIVQVNITSWMEAFRPFGCGHSWGTRIHTVMEADEVRR
jgi:hypothetical protein